MVLSDYDSTKIIIEEFDVGRDITKNEFLTICKPLFEKFKSKLKDFIKVWKYLISDIILIGGASKMPEIENILREEFPLQRIRKDIDPSTSVAKGAAIRASILTNPEEFCNINLLDVTNLSLGTNVYEKQKKLWNNGYNY